MAIVGSQVPFRVQVRSAAKRVDDWNTGFLKISAVSGDYYEAVHYLRCRYETVLHRHRLSTGTQTRQ